MPRKEEKVWNRFAGIYDRFMKKDMGAHRQVIEKIACRLGREDKVLEIATGTGSISLGLSACIKQIDAVDFSCEMIRKAIMKALHVV